LCIICVKEARKKICHVHIQQEPAKQKGKEIKRKEPIKIIERR